MEMKRILVIVFFIISSKSFLTAQIEKYHRAEIFLKQEPIQKLAVLGIETDHGMLRQGHSFISDFSENELLRITNAGFETSILIEDVSSYYRSLYKKGDFEKSRAIQDECGLKKVKTPVNFQEGSQSGFYSYQEILDNFNAMHQQYPQLISELSPISDTLLTMENRTVNWVRVSDNPNSDEPNEPEVLMSSLHHSREPLSVSQLIFFTWYLLENYQNDIEIKQILDQTELYIVPCVNPDGYLYNEVSEPGGGGLWRKNRRNNEDGSFGVDLNRNYGKFWGFDDFGSSPNTIDQTYRGTAPFSEPETRLMKLFTEQHQFIYAINNHSFSNVLIYPYGNLENAQCPDSTTFRNLSEAMCSENHFYYGTVPETIYYTGNGGSDDWMYGDTTTKPAVFAFTPEFGERFYGFWPPAEIIIPASANEVYMNLKTLKLALAYAEVVDDAPYYIPPGTNGSLPFRFVSLGNTSGNFTVEGIGISNISFTDFSPVNINSPIRFDTSSHSVSYALPPNLQAGDTIKYVWLVQVNGNYWRDTITHIFGQPIYLINDSIENGDNWVSEANTQLWSTTTERFHSAPFSLTDSPFSPYFSNEENSMEFENEIDLTEFIDARLDYWVWWYTEQYYDIASIQIKRENGVWEKLCAEYTSIHENFEGVDAEPNYEDRTRLWRKESISLKQYVGEKIRLRYHFISDQFSELDGIYVDDIQLYGIRNTPQSLEEINETSFQIYPNPSNSEFQVYCKSIEFKGKIFDVTGKLVLLFNSSNGSVNIETSELSNGIYFIQLLDKEGFTETQKLIIQH